MHYCIQFLNQELHERKKEAKKKLMWVLIVDVRAVRKQNMSLWHHD